MNWRFLLQGGEPAPENYQKAVRALCGAQADEILKLYPASNRDETIEAATALASDRFIAYSTWKWADVCAATGGKPVYRYYYLRPRPAMNPEMGDAAPGLAGGVVRGAAKGALAVPPARGAVHSAEIEYTLGNLATNKVYAWTADDYRVSKTIEEYFANFVKAGNPNGPGLPNWPEMTPSGPSQVMQIDVESVAKPEQGRERYRFLDRIAAKAGKQGRRAGSVTDSTTV
jgi:para-nitrobenzyl esterase